MHQSKLKTLVKKTGYALLLVFSVTANQLFALDIGDTAPAFTLTDSNGKTHNLADFKGKYVVLEWVNYDCPFVVKQYKPGKMQQLQKEFTEKGVVWLSINSSAPGRQGHFSNDEINQRMQKNGAAPTAYLIDESGKVGKKYAAKVTPHMFIIDPQQNLAFEGGIDNIHSVSPNDVKKAKNYVETALNEALAGKKISEPFSEIYGCSVKYAK